MFDEGGHRGMALQLFRSAGLSDEETEAVMQRMNDEYSDTSKKIYMKQWVSEILSVLQVVTDMF